MRKRVAGAGILVAIGIGMWLNSLFKGLGPGGEGEGVGRSENVSVNADSSHVSIDSSADHTAASGGRQSPDSRSAPTVLIDGRRYLLQVGTGSEESFRPAELDEIVRLAKEAQPGEDGIRLTIKRRRSSRVLAESELQDALSSAGIEQSEILDHPGFVE